MARKRQTGKGKAAAGKRGAAKPARVKPADKRPKPVSLDRVKRVYEKYKPLLMACDGVKAVTYGVKKTNEQGYLFKGAAGDRPIYCIIVHVEAKDENMERAAPGYIPKRLDGVRTDVVVNKPVVIQAFANVSVGKRIFLKRANGTPICSGTLGAVAEDDNGNLMALSAAHVAFGPTLDPGPGAFVELADGTKLGSPVRSGFNGPYSVPFGPLDGGAIFMEPEHKAKKAAESLASFAELTSTAVKIVGAVSGVNTGNVVDFHTDSIQIEIAPGTSLALGSVVRIQPDNGSFGVSGDSGSVLFGVTGKSRVAVGLYVGTELGGGDGFALMLNDVVNALQLVWRS